MASRIPALHAAALLGAVLFLAGCGPEKLHVYAYRGEVMGAPYLVKVVGPRKLDRVGYQELSQAIQYRLAAIFSKASQSMPGSELARFNQHEDVTPFQVSEEMLTMFRQAVELSAQTGGAFDITVEPLRRAWGFSDESGAGRIPARSVLQGLRQRIGWEKLEVRVSDSAVAKRDAVIACTLTSLVHGYAVDEISWMLAAIGWPNHMVEVGAEVRTSGVNRGNRPWHISIQRAQQHDGSMSGLVPISGLAIAVSGNEEYFLAEDGRYYSYHLDPRTGLPIGHDTLSATVLTDSCITANALSKALLVMGAEEGFRFAEERNLAALFLLETEDARIEEMATSRFREIAEPQPLQAKLLQAPGSRP